ncbi:ribonuclease H-like domain-containing protein, partial [Tanacetum coccineum]
IDGNKPVGINKKKLECFKCHNTSHFARECPSKGTNDGKKRDSFYQDQGAGKKEQNHNCLLTMDFQKQQLSLNEQLTFQANEIYAKDEKLKRYRRIGMKAVKENEQLQKTGPQKPEISDSDDNSTEHSTCQSNDSEGSFGNPSEHSSESESESISVPNEMSASKSVITNEKVVSESKEVEPSCVTHVKTPRKQMKNQETHEVKRKNWNEMMGRELGEGYSFIKKKCFVCGSLSHLIKDCDYYEKKMAREAELKKQRVFNTGNGVAKPVWNNAHRVNHANHFVPRPVQLNAVRQNVNSVRPNVNTGRVNVNSVRHNVNSVRTNVNTSRSKQPVPTCNSNSFSPIRPQVNKFNQRSHFSKSHSPVRRPIVRNTAKMSYFNAVKGKRGTVVKTSADPSHPLPSEATTIPPLSQPAPPTPIADTTKASPSPTPSPAHEPIEHTFEQPSSDQQPPTPRQEATTSQLLTRIDDLEKQLKETKQTFGKAILTLVERKISDLEVALKRKDQDGFGLYEEVLSLPSEKVNAGLAYKVSFWYGCIAYNLNREQKKRKAQVQFEAQSYTEEDWDTIRAKLEANAELKRQL